MDFDAFLVNHLGEIGRAQKIILFFVCLVEIPAAFNSLGIVFLAGVPDHWCSVPELEHLNLSVDVLKNLTIPREEKDGEMIYSSCQRYSANFTGWTVEDIQDADDLQSTWNTTNCPSGWVYDDSIYKSTIVTDWDLVCDKSWYQATASSVYMAGLMVGILSMSVISDMFGRRISIWMCMAFLYILTLVVMFSPNIVGFLILRFLVAVFSMGFSTTTYVLCLETVGPSWRLHASQAIWYAWSLAYMLIAGLAYGIRHWPMLQLTFFFGCLVSIPNALLPESPRWLYTRQETDKADAVIKKIAKLNKAKIPEPLNITIKAEKKGYIWDMLRTPRLRLRSLNLFFNWCVNSMVYYGLSLNTSNLGGDHYLNFFISAAVEIPAYIASHVAVVYLGRKWPLAASLWLGGVALLCTMAVPSHLNWIAILLSMIGKFGITSSFGIVYVFTTELYPTVIRNTALGTCSFFARIGGVVAPFILLLSDISKYIPLVIFGVISVLAGILTLVLPETGGTSMPETLEDGENFGRKSKKNIGETEKQYSNNDGVTNPSFEDEQTEL